MSCTIRKTRGEEKGDCQLQELGETRQSCYEWCSDCGVIRRLDLDTNEYSLGIPAFDNQTGGEA